MHSYHVALTTHEDTCERMFCKIPPISEVTILHPRQIPTVYDKTKERVLNPSLYDQYIAMPNKM